MSLYVIITPVFNEAKYLDRFIESIVAQTIKPIKLLFVDDNSDDDSASIIFKYQKHIKWIEYLYHSSQPKKVQGSKVIQAFNFGLSKTDITGINFISKIDADLELPKNYFEEICKTFDENPAVGICGGIIQELKDKEWITIRESKYHIRGALKSYRIKCFMDIKGLNPVLGWDGLDEMKAFQLGWDTSTINVLVKHLRPASSDYNPLIMNFQYGIANYKNGSSFFLALVRFLVRIKDKPYFFSAFSFLFGYIKAFLFRSNKNVDKELASFINKYHNRRLFTLKRY